MVSDDILKLTAIQREVLRALRDGTVMTVDRHNMPWLGVRPLQPHTRYFLVKHHLIMKRDPSSAVTARGNGYVISTKGLVALERAAATAKPRKDRTTTTPADDPDRTRPATERQLAYAHSLGIAIPANATLEQVSDLITRRTEPAADAWLVRRAQALGGHLDDARYLAHGYVAEQVRRILAAGPEGMATRELAFWYLLSVYRHCSGGGWTSPADSGLPEETVWGFADLLLQDAPAHNSIVREYGHDPLYELLVFGDGYGGTRSRRTAAYPKSLDMLKTAGLA